MAPGTTPAGVGEGLGDAVGDDEGLAVGVIMLTGGVGDGWPRLRSCMAPKARPRPATRTNAAMATAGSMAKRLSRGRSPRPAIKDVARSGRGFASRRKPCANRRSRLSPSVGLAIRLTAP